MSTALEPRQPCGQSAQSERAARVGERLLAYLGLGLGAVVAILPGGLAVAVQTDHVTGVVRLSDLVRR